MTKPKLIVPKHVWDGKQAEQKKQELEKIPEPTGFRIVLFPLKLEQYNYCIRITPLNYAAIDYCSMVNEDVQTLPRQAMDMFTMMNRIV